MKRFTLISGLILSSMILFGQSEKYSTAMRANISMLDSALMKGKIGEIANNFERIGDAEKTQWLPYYYASYCTVMQAFTEKDKNKWDGIADKAEVLLNKAEALNGKENSETCVIRSMIASAHMMVDPPVRWQQYGAASASNIEKAKMMDPLNPRPVYLEGQAKFYTPEAFGGGKAAAKEIFEKALEMFNSFQPASPLHPKWGMATTRYFLSLTAGK